MHWVAIFPAAYRAFGAFCVLFVILSGSFAAAEENRLAVLMLGDQGHHRPAELAKVLTPALARVGIDVTYTEDVTELNPQNLAAHDCLLLYNNIDAVAAEQEKALLEYVEGGGGLVVVHCASYSFRNSPPFIALVGGQFHHHGTGVFRTRIIDAQHPAMRGLKSFESWDETYVHQKLADDIRVLMVREHEGGYEPWTWVREQGRGRVFYTASGHNERTWTVPGFHRLIEQGVRWAAGTLHDRPVRVAKGKDLPLPLSPEESMKHMHVPEGFRVELFASEADIYQTIAMNFDERGRLWTLETLDYPNALLPESKGHDRIRILEDSDGDGRADKTTTFARNLNLPSAITFGGGGVIVANSPDIVLLKDNDGDDVADERRVLLTGFRRWDTHATSSNFWYGLDNWIWGCVGYSGGKVASGGETQEFGQGIFRFRPDGSHFEFLTSTSNNTWGLGFSEGGDVFASTANNDHSVHMAIANRYIEGVRGWHAVGNRFMADHRRAHPIVKQLNQWDWRGSYTAAANASVYTARQFPAFYRNRVKFVCEPTIHLIHADLLTRAGSDFVARDGYNFFASDDPYTAPVQALVGPDGALWVLDWYSYQMLHNNPGQPESEHGTGNAWLTNQRDLQRCRIYRIVHESAKRGEPIRLDRAEPERLVETLKHGNMLWRLTAQRLLVKRGKTDVLPRLVQLVQEDHEGRAALHAMWTMEGLGAFREPGGSSEQALERGLAHRSPDVRRGALKIVPKTQKGLERILAAGLVRDDDALVRKDALLAMSEAPASQAAGEAVAAMLAEPRNAKDRWIPLAATIAAARHDVPFLKAAASAKISGEAHEAFSKSVRAVAEHFARGAGSESLAAVLDAMAGAEAFVAEAATAGLVAGWPENRPPPLRDALQQSLAALLKSPSVRTRTSVVTLAERWGGGKQFERLIADLVRDYVALVADEERAEDERVEAARQLLLLDREDDKIGAVLDAITPRSSPQLADGMLSAVAQRDSPQVAAAILARWSGFTPAVRRTAMSILMRRAGWTEAMIGALESGAVDVADLTIEQTQRLTLHSNSTIAERAKKLLAGRSGLADPDRQKIVAELLPLARQRGDLALGKQVFEKNCAQCHTLNGQGGKVGPDLTGIAGGNRQAILTEILDPNRSVEGNYRQWQVATDNGLILSGRLMNETKTSLMLYDSNGKEHTVLRDNVESLRMSPRSVMPEGFERLPHEELVALLEYVTARGNFVPLDLRSAANAVSTRPLFQTGRMHERLIFSTWGTHTLHRVPFHVIDPQVDTAANVIVLYGPRGDLCRSKPEVVSIDCRVPAKAIHLLSGVSGWGYPAILDRSVSMIVRLHYAGGQTEDHPLVNGVHFADFVRVVEVPGSKLARKLRERQIRYLSITPGRSEEIERIELVKGPDETAPVVMAVTVEVKR